MWIVVYEQKHCIITLVPVHHMDLLRVQVKSYGIEGY